MLFINKHHKVSFSSQSVIFISLHIFGDFLGKITVCDAYHKEHASH